MGGKIRPFRFELFHRKISYVGSKSFFIGKFIPGPTNKNWMSFNFFLMEIPIMRNIERKKLSHFMAFPDVF